MYEMVKLDEHGFPVPDNEPNVEPNSLWRCIDPCAFLCYAIQTNALPFDPAIKLTLDNFGWLNKDGFPDYDKMMREFQRFKK